MTVRWRWLAPAFAAFLALGAGTAFGQPTVVGTRPDCVTAVGQAIFSGFGYRHNVHVTNRCTYTIDCHIYTDVNPQVQNLHVAAGGAGDVSTFLSSPARVFVAHVDCPHTGDPVISDPTE